MKHNAKDRILSLLLSFILLFSLLPASALAAEDAQDTDAENPTATETAEDAGSIPAPVSAPASQSEAGGEVPFTVSADGENLTQISLTEDGYSYIDWSGSLVVADLYTVTVPAGTVTVDFTYPENRLAYNYDADGVYVDSENNNVYPGDTWMTGADTSTNYVDADDNGVPDYIFVQTPYDADFNSDLLYVVTFAYDVAPDAGDDSGDDEGGAGKEPMPPLNASVEDIYATTGAYILKNLPDPVYGAEWQVLGLARAGYAVPDGYYEQYYNSVAETLDLLGGVLSASSYTNYSRTTLALTAAGYDPRDVGGHNLLEPLADYDQVVKQGVNGALYALLALDCGEYEIPAVSEGKTQTTRENLIAFILGKQLSDGGWAITETSADPDVTAIALQALAPYYDADTAVREAADKALVWLSEAQNGQGGYESWGTAASESSAQVIVALTALGIDPDTDERFVKDGGSVLDALCNYYVEGGGFRHVADGERNGLATEQGYYALAAYFRLQAGQTSLFDMTDVALTVESNPSNASGSAGTGDMGSTSPKTGDISAPVLAFTLLLASAMAALLLEQKRRAQ